MIGENLEVFTFEYLVTKALSKVPDTVDKREGSIIYDAIAPACYELSEYYMELKKLLDAVFISTATGEYLDNKVLEQGLTRLPATKAIRKGVFTGANNLPINIAIGSRFSTFEGQNSVNFTVVGTYDVDGIVEPGSYRLECEELGSIGNNYVGDLLTITNINGLSTAKLTTILVPARDIETDEQLRARYLLAVKQKPFGGNIAQYDEEIKNIEGVGEVQVYPVWNGGGTVNCSIVGPDYKDVSNDFISQVQELIDPQPQGSGIGIAPIGHKVTITTPKTKSINISAKVTIDSRYTLSQLEESIKQAIEAYLLQLRTVWGTADELGRYSLSVYVSRINNAILSISGVANVTNITINGSSSDLQLTLQQDIPNNKYGVELPILGTVTLNE